MVVDLFFFSSRRRHTRSKRDWSSDVCSSDLPRAVLRHVALAASRSAHVAAGLEHVGRAAGARPRAHLVGITDVARAHAAGRPRVPRRVLTRDARAVALVERAGVAVGGARRPRSLLRVGGAGRPVAWAVLRQVTFPCRRPALDTRGFKAVGRAGRARAGAGRGHVARTRRRTARRSRVPRRVLTRDARAVALVERARVPVPTRRSSDLLLRVGGAGRPVAWAVLRQVTFPCRRPALDTRGFKAVGRAGRARA